MKTILSEKEIRVTVVGIDATGAELVRVDAGNGVCTVDEPRTSSTVAIVAVSQVTDTRA